MATNNTTSSAFPYLYFLPAFLLRLQNHALKTSHANATIKSTDICTFACTVHMHDTDNVQNIKIKVTSMFAPLPLCIQNLQSTQVAAAKIKTMTEQATAKHMYTQQCDAESARAHSKAEQSEKAAVAANRDAATARKEATVAEKKASSAKQAFRLVSAALLPLKRSLVAAEPLQQSRPNPAGRSNNPRIMSNNSSEKIIYVESNNLAVVLEMMRTGTFPTIYDFQGKTCSTTAQAALLFPPIISHGATGPFY